MQKKILLTVLSLSITVFAVNAQSKMTLKECRDKAVEYNRELKIAHYNMQEAIANKKAAKTAYLPKLEASGTAMYMPNMDDISMPGGFLPTASSADAASKGQFTGQSNVWSPGMNIELGNMTIIYGSVNLTQPIYAGGKILYSNKQATAGVNIYSSAYTLKYSEIIEKTDQAYWNMLAIAENVKLAEKYIAMLTELEEQMTEMYNLGLTPASEKLKVTVQKNEAQLNLLKAKNGLRISKMYLNQVIGQDINSEITVADSLEMSAKMPELSGGVLAAQTNRAELNILKNKLAIAEYDKKITMADYKPQLGVSAGYTTSYISNFAEDFEFRPSISGQLTIPLFNWGQRKHKRNAAKLKIKAAETELSNTNELINLEVNQVRIEIEEAYEAILIAQKNIKEAQESLDETQASFKVGLNTTTELLNAQADWQNANAQLIGSFANYEVLKTKWDKVTGKLVAPE
jgi:outer membrane protein TolC